MTTFAEHAVSRAMTPIRNAVASGAIPGAVLAVATADSKAIRSAGYAIITPVVESLADDTWFDLASLTKVIFTTPAVLRLIDAGRLTLDSKLGDIFREMESPARNLTVRECLGHCTWLPAHMPLHLLGLESEALKKWILSHAWEMGPCVYSDINFIILGLMVERLTGQRLAAMPLSPGLSFAPDPHRCAATEYCAWRQRDLRGEVHDENAAVLGGAAGHAGLFGTASGVIDFARSILTGDGWSSASLNSMRAPQRATRTLGWELRHEGWPGGDAASNGAIGHNGFTGTGLWIDFERGVSWTLLTNRVHPSRSRPTGIGDLRRIVGDLVVKSIDEGHF
jgi:CubicO group peptidase (beta-lactamase class C family)